ncbi:hypothetical protein M011DRAFT_137343 [Sporormia fimetaria CBS 119925]|uniref:DUF7053 domain-containing protein n=1 Tax=Sporormia fimetaria CBS 119925 TaxID=1340428 RepID=A0A6A6V4B8_9PLEO|nr:hypothetical protein M011DRAFT_137343 [Sporormia fimetaria CBS 119925]
MEIHLGRYLSGWKPSLSVPPRTSSSALRMMRKKVNYTNVTPIPSFIPRQLAIDILHSHGEIIELNPLVTGFEPIKAPRDAPADEFYSTWYEISERIQYVPGVGRLGSGKIKFKGCFHDMPWGLQTHIYAPAGVDLRNKWQICGNQPGEPAETRELGIDAPVEGLYLREDIQITCNFSMVSFVKKETKAASKVLVERLIKKAELLDAGILRGMMENGKLKTINPADRSHRPASSADGRHKLASDPDPYLRPIKHEDTPGVAQSQTEVIMELEGDSYHPEAAPSHLGARYSSGTESALASPNPSDGRWSHASNEYSSRPSSYASDGFRSPRMDHAGFAAELPTMEETREEHENTRRRLEGETYPKDQKYKYNPQDFAHMPTTIPQQQAYPQQYPYGR